MIRLGLTGSIGMGKTTTAGLFASEGVPVFESDPAVHRAYAPGGGAVAGIGAAFPGVVRDGAVDRRQLAARVLGSPAALRSLEAIVHPLVAAERRAFVQRAEAGGAPMVLFDIPLLYETGAETEVDAVVVVTASPDIQRARVLARPGMTPEKFEAILARQLPDAEKRARADFVIDTGSGLEAARRDVRAVLDCVRRTGWRPAHPRRPDALDDPAEPSQ